MKSYGLLVAFVLLLTLGVCFSLDEEHGDDYLSSRENTYDHEEFWPSHSYYTRMINRPNGPKDNKTDLDEEPDSAKYGDFTDWPSASDSDIEEKHPLAEPPAQPSECSCSCWYGKCRLRNSFCETMYKPDLDIVDRKIGLWCSGEMLHGSKDKELPVLFAPPFQPPRGEEYPDHPSTKDIRAASLKHGSYLHEDEPEAPQESGYKWDDKDDHSSLIASLKSKSDEHNALLAHLHQMSGRSLDILSTIKTHRKDSHADLLHHLDGLGMGAQAKDIDPLRSNYHGDLLQQLMKGEGGKEWHDIDGHHDYSSLRGHHLMSHIFPEDMVQDYLEKGEEKKPEEAPTAEEKEEVPVTKEREEVPKGDKKIPTPEKKEPTVEKAMTDPIHSWIPAKYRAHELLMRHHQIQSLVNPLHVPFTSPEHMEEVPIPPYSASFCKTLKHEKRMLEDDIMDCQRAGINCQNSCRLRNYCSTVL